MRAILANKEARCELSAGVEVSLREGDGRKLLFVLNTEHEPKIADLPAGTDLLTDKAVSGPTELGGYDVLVIERSA